MMTTTPALNDDLVPRLMDYGLTLDEHVVICDRRAVDEAASALEAQSKEIEALRSALEPFVAAFDVRRDAYSRRHKDRELGYANFDKMPDAWPMEKIEFRMSHFRRARTALKGA